MKIKSGTEPKTKSKMICILFQLKRNNILYYIAIRGHALEIAKFLSLLWKL